MAPRHVALAASAVAVLGMVIYLALEVGREPAVPAELAASSTRTVASRGDEPSRPEAVAAAPEQPTGGRAHEPRFTRTFGTVGKPAGADSGKVAPPAVDGPVMGTTASAVKVEAMMAQANKAYDKGDLDEARNFATQALHDDPTNPRMLRILVSSACIEGDAGEAQKHYALLPEGDQQQMRTRCERYGVTFK